LAAVAVFHSGFDAGLYTAVVLAWLLSFFVEALIIRSAGRRSTEVRADGGSGLVILLSVFAALAIASAFAASGVGLLPRPFFFAGLVIMVAGIAFRLWAVGTLRSFFSYTVQIKKEHRVVQSGPYRFVRHPAYAGSLLTIVGAGFALQSWGAILAVVGVFALTFGYRIRVEERAMIGALGEDYALYSRRVKRLIPCVF
jgi:protein-S-isoprenylcysteine O-methyltransferase Ste14